MLSRVMCQHQSKRRHCLLRQLNFRPLWKPRQKRMQYIRTIMKNIKKSAGQIYTFEDLPTEEVGKGVNRELHLKKSFPVYQAVRRAQVTGEVWSARWCYRRKGPKQVRARFVVRQFATTWTQTAFYSPAVSSPPQQWCSCSDSISASAHHLPL